MDKNLNKFREIAEGRGARSQRVRWDLTTEWPQQMRKEFEKEWILVFV